MNIPPRSKPVLAVALHHHNDTPLPDFGGLTPAQMHPLLYQPLGPASVVRLRPAVPDGIVYRKTLVLQGKYGAGKKRPLWSSYAAFRDVSLINDSPWGYLSGQPDPYRNFSPRCNENPVTVSTTAGRRTERTPLSPRARWDPPFSGGVNNVFDARYFTRRAGGYPGPGILPADGRTWFAGLGLTL